MIDRLKAWIDWYARIGVRDLPKAERSGRYAFNLMALAGAVTTPPWMIGYALIDPIGMAPLWLSIAPVCLMILLPLCAKYSTIAAHLIGGGLLIVCFAHATYLTGRDSGLYLFIFNGLIIVVMHQSAARPKETVVLAAICAAAILGCYLMFPEPSGRLPVAARFNTSVFFLTLSTLILQMTQTLFALNMQVAEAEAALDAEHERSESLLRNLLPDEIATRLKERPGEVIADELPAVTLLFADIVDFTPRAKKDSPEQVVAFLNRIFSAFDQLTEDRGLEKIKTIGDANMVAAGLPNARADHAQIIADMALAMRQTAERLSSEMGEVVELRIGIHSGPAIAGVIGTSKVFYDVWGDTVNTASRMESHGAPGRIHVTDATRSLLADAYQFTPRAPVEIKGVGMMQTYWMTAPA